MLKTRTKSKDSDESQLSYTKYNCLYHIVFIPKYRRKAIYGKLRRDIGIILRRLCEYKEVEIIEVKILLKLSVSQFMGYLKEKSALMIFENHANLKYKYGQRTFWARGYSRIKQKHNKKIYKRTRVT